jgi:hypothetical protein
VQSNRYSCQIVMQLEFFYVFSKNIRIQNFIEIRPSVSDGPTDRHDEANTGGADKSLA